MFHQDRIVTKTESLPDPFSAERRVVVEFHDEPVVGVQNAYLSAVRRWRVANAAPGRRVGRDPLGRAEGQHPITFGISGTDCRHTHRMLFELLSLISVDEMDE